MLRSHMVVNLDPSPTNALRVSLYQLLSITSHFGLSALLRKTQPHPRAKPISILPLATSRKFKRTFIFALDNGQHVLAVGSICEARAVISPLAKIPSINQSIENRSKLRKSEQERVHCLIAIKIIQRCWRRRRRFRPCNSKFLESIVFVESSASHTFSLEHHVARREYCQDKEAVV